MVGKKRTEIEFSEIESQEMVARSRELRHELARRRSIRDFVPRPIPREVLENAVATAGSAPSGANLQPWHFVVVTDAAAKRKIRERSEEVERAFYETRITEEWLGALEQLEVDTDKPFLEEASALIVVFRKNHVVDNEGVSHKTYYPMESTGIATGYLIAALHLSGLAMLTYTPAPMTFLRELLQRPESDIPFLLLAVGYPRSGATVPTISRHELGEISTFVESP